MATAATHFGTCQVCNSRQKLPGGRMAKHGYTLDYGFFNGTCWGSDELPFEQSKDLIEGAITRAAARAVELDQQAAELSKPATVAKAMAHVYRDSRQCKNGEKPGYFWKEGDIAEKRMHGGYRFALIAADGREYGVGHGQNYNATVLDAATHNNQQYAAFLRKLAQQARDYAQWQKGRIKDWKPTELHPVSASEKAAAAPRVHFKAAKYGRKDVPMCAASASGAQRMGGARTTENRAEVTCAGCLKRLAERDERERAKAEAK